MARIYTGLAAWNLLFLANAFVMGFLRGHAVEPRIHLLSGLFAAIFCCLVHAIVFAHFIGSGKWIKKGVDAAGMDPAIIKRTKRFKGKVFPFALFSMLFVVATAVLGGGADMGPVAPAVHFSFGIATLALNVLATLFERSAIGENSTLIDRVAAENRDRIAQGIAQTQLPAAADEATRAGSMVFLFLAANVWLLYAYRRFAMRHHDEPWLVYVVLCAVLVIVGLRMRAAEGSPRV
jgi:H+/Cl- antiporter ClcA